MERSGRILLLASIAILVFAACYITGNLDYIKNLIAQNKVVQGGESKSNSNSMYILFLGIDKSMDRESWLESYRTDTIAVVRINLETKKIKVLSIPRDTYTYVPIEGKFDKINHAYAFGSLKDRGVQASTEAVNCFLGKNIVNHYFLMDMDPIPKIVDQVGGVIIDVEIDMKDHGANLSKGIQLLNGEQSFDYIHWRYSAGGDIDRIKRQQKFAEAFFKQQRDSGRMLQVIQIILQSQNNIRTDLSTKQIVDLGKLLSEIPDGSISYYNIMGSGRMLNGVSYWVMDTEDKEKVLKDFLVKN